MRCSPPELKQKWEEYISYHAGDGGGGGGEEPEPEPIRRQKEMEQHRNQMAGKQPPPPPPLPPPPPPPPNGEEGKQDAMGASGGGMKLKDVVAAIRDEVGLDSELAPKDVRTVLFSGVCGGS